MKLSIFSCKVSAEKKGGLEYCVRKCGCMGMRGKGKRKKTFGRRGKKQSTMGEGWDGQDNGGRSRKKKKEIELSFQKLLAYCYDLRLE